MSKALSAIAASLALLSAAGCGSVPSNPGVGRAASIDHVALSADGNAVDVVVIGAAPLSEGARCGADYELASSAFNGTVLQVLVKQTAERKGDCSPTELACCEHKFTISFPTEHWVDRVRDLSAGIVRELFLPPPGGLYELNGLPAGWELQRAFATSGRTWIRLYAPDSDPPPWDRQTLLFRTSFGGGIFTDPSRVQPPVIINGVEAQVMRYPEADNLINLQWLVDGQALTLQSYEPAMSIDQLVALANAVTRGR
jgi:hypothetical protein